MNTVEQNDSALDRRKMFRLGFTALAEVVDIETAQLSLSANDRYRHRWLFPRYDVPIVGRFTSSRDAWTWAYAISGRRQCRFFAGSMGMGVAFDKLTRDQRVALMRLI